MRSPTHLALAGLIGATAAGLGHAPDTVAGAALAVGSLLPDLDTTTSGIGRFAKPLSRLLERRLGHRTLTHSLLGVGLVALLAAPLWLLTPTPWGWLLIGYLSHLLLDSANVTGVPLLWPARVETVMVHNRGLRVPYGSPREFAILATFALLSLAVLPFTRDGFLPWFHRLLGSPYGAVEDFLRWRDRYEVWADVTGYNLVSGDVVDGRYRAIDALHTEQLVVEGPSGRAFRVGLGGDSDIITTRIAVWRGDPIGVHVDQLELSGRTIEELLAALPAGARRVLVTGSLVLQGPRLQLPVASGWMRRIDVVGHETLLRSAGPADLRWLVGQVILRGSIVVRSEYPQPGAATPVTLSSPPGRAFSHELPGLPSLTGLLVAVGDEVVQGQPIARYVDDLALAEAAERLVSAERNLALAEQTLAWAEERAALAAAQRSDEVQAAEAELRRTRVLVEAGSLPGRDLAEAEFRLRSAERSRLEAATARTSERQRLSAAIDDARLTVLAADRRRQEVLDTQWVLAALSGVVVSVVTDGGARGGVDVVVTIWQSTGR